MAEERAWFMDEGRRILEEIDRIRRENAWMRQKDEPMSWMMLLWKRIKWVLMNMVDVRGMFRKLNEIDRKVDELGRKKDWLDQWMAHLDMMEAEHAHQNDHTW